MKFALFASVAMLSLGSTQAASTVALGDLVLYFQQIGGNNTVYANLGSAATLYRGTSSGPNAGLQALNIIDINTTLVSAFGAGWASDNTIFAGLGAVRASTGTTVVNGDQNATIYISRSRNGVGTLGEVNSTPWNFSSTGDGGGTQGSAANNVLALRTDFAAELPLHDQGIVTRANSVIDDQNPVNPTTLAQGVAFGRFSGGVQQQGSATAFGVFGPAGQVEFALDLNRMVPDGTVSTNEIAGPGQIGSYEGTVVVGTNGKVSFVTVPEPSGTLALGILGTIAGLGYRRRKA